MGNFDNPLILAIETSGRLGSVALAQGDKLLAESHFSGPMRHSAEIFPAITNLLSKFSKKPDQIEQVYISVGPGSFTGLRIAVTIAKTLALANNTKIVAVDTLDCIAANVIGFTAEHAWLGHPCSGENAEKKNNLRGLCDLSGEISRLAVILDAKRGQFFVAVYEKTPLRQAQGRQDPRPQTTDAQNDLSFPRKRESSIDYPLYATRYPLKKVLPDCLMTAEEFLDRFTDKSITLIGEGLVFYKDKFTHKNVSVLDDKFWNPSAANVHRLGWQLASHDQFADPLTLTPNYIRGPDAIVKQR